MSAMTFDLVSTVSESDEVEFTEGAAKGGVNSELIDLVSTSSECSDDETINSIFIYSANRLVGKALLNTCSSNNFIIDPGCTQAVKKFNTAKECRQQQEGVFSASQWNPPASNRRFRSIRQLGCIPVCHVSPTLD